MNTALKGGEFIETATGGEEFQSASLAPSGGKDVAAVEASAEVPEAARRVSERLLRTERSYKVAIAQITTDPGRIRENARKVIGYIDQAKARGAQLVVFPELAIPGYGSMDLFFNRSYVEENAAALESIKAASDGITVIVGFARPHEGRVRPGARPSLYNSAAILRDGKLIYCQDKELLPTYNIFFEERYFERASRRAVVDVGGVKIGTEICEDLWSKDYPSNPTTELAAQGAEIIVNLSASPFHVGKIPVRTDLIRSAALEHKVPFIYANLVGSFDGYEGEVVFDGRSIIMGPRGEFKAMGAGFREDLVIVDVFGPQELEIPEVGEIEELYEALKLGVRDYFRRVGRLAGFTQAIVGLSGGIDSAVVAALAADALGPEKLLGITMPSNYSSSETRSDAQLLAENLGIRFKTVPIQREVEAVLGQLRADPEIVDKPENVAEENVQARLRMLNLMFYANKFGGLVLNTGNKTELALDNCTIYGDMVGGFSVLGDVDKDRVYQLARFINERAGREVIPLTTIERVPTAELKAGQIDADVMGEDPQTIAPVVREIVEQGLSYEDALQRFGKRYSPELLERWFKRLDSSEWKRRQAAPSIRVTPLSFGNGRRMPISHGYITRTK